MYRKRKRSTIAYLMLHWFLLFVEECLFILLICIPLFYPPFSPDCSSHDLIIMACKYKIITIIKKCWQYKTGRKRLAPCQTEDPNDPLMIQWLMRGVCHWLICPTNWQTKHVSCNSHLCFGHNSTNDIGQIRVSSQQNLFFSNWITNVLLGSCLVKCVAWFLFGLPVAAIKCSNYTHINRYVVKTLIKRYSVNERAQIVFPVMVPMPPTHAEGCR